MVDIASISRWLPDIIQAFRAAGGTSRFPQIYRWIQSNRRLLPEEWEALIRATVYHHSSDSPVYKQGNPDVFFKKGYGLWALRHPNDTIRGKTERDLSIQVWEGLTKEQLESYSGNGDALIADVKAEVEKLKKKYKIL